MAGEDLDDELAQIQADTERRIADAKARAKSTGKSTKAAAAKAAPEEPAEEGHQTWDAFWEEIEREEADERGEAATETIRGVTVVVPHDLPLRFQRRLDQIQDKEKAVRAQVLEFAAADAELNARETRGEDVTTEREALQAEVSVLENDSDAMDDTKELLEDLFGADVLDQWVENGMKEKEFSVVLLWGMAHGKGQPMTHREAYEAHRSAEGKGRPTATGSPGSGHRQTSKPSAKKKRPAATGGRSKRTSGGSTASGRATSRS